MVHNTYIIKCRTRDQRKSILVLRSAFMDRSSYYSYYSIIQVLVFFLSQVMTGGFPSHMGLSPYMTHIVDAGGSHVYVWTGADSHHKDRR